MIDLKEINRDNFEACLALALTPEQQAFVATNKYSLAEAYVLQKGPESPFPFAIYKDEEMVGFMSFWYSPYIEGDEEYDDSSFYLARMMIDKKHQGKGFGREAMQKAIDFMKKYENGLAEKIVLSCDPENKNAMALYESLSFKDSGDRDDDGDYMMILELKND